MPSLFLVYNKCFTSYHAILAIWHSRCICTFVVLYGQDSTLWFSYTKSFKDAYVTGFWKTDWIVTLGLFYFIGPANVYTYTLHIHSAITRLGWLVCFSRASFANPVISWLRQWDSWGHYMEGMGLILTPVFRGDVSDAIQACLGLWLALLEPIANPNSPNRGFNLPPASHPSHPSIHWHLFSDFLPFHSPVKEKGKHGRMKG